MILRLLLPTLLLFLEFLPCVTHAQPQSPLPVWDDRLALPEERDWLVHQMNRKATLYKSKDGRSLVLFNGLLRRSFLIEPGLACVDFQYVVSGQQLLRAVRPEARVTIDGQTFDLGGLTGQREFAYLTPEVIGALQKKQ